MAQEERAEKSNPGVHMLKLRHNLQAISNEDVGIFPPPCFKIFQESYKSVLDLVRNSTNRFCYTPMFGRLTTLKASCTTRCVLTRKTMDIANATHQRDVILANTEPQEINKRNGQPGETQIDEWSTNVQQAG